MKMMKAICPQISQICADASEARGCDVGIMPMLAGLGWFNLRNLRNLRIDFGLVA
jgi:hypothetical protein